MLVFHKLCVRYLSSNQLLSELKAFTTGRHGLCCHWRKCALLLEFILLFVYVLLHCLKISLPMFPCNTNFHINPLYQLLRLFVDLGFEGTFVLFFRLNSLLYLTLLNFRFIDPLYISIHKVAPINWLYRLLTSCDILVIFEAVFF